MESPLNFVSPQSCNLCWWGSCPKRTPSSHLTTSFWSLMCTSLAWWGWPFAPTNLPISGRDTRSKPHAYCHLTHPHVGASNERPGSVACASIVKTFFVLVQKLICSVLTDGTHLVGGTRGDMRDKVSGTGWRNCRLLIICPQK